MHKTQVSLCCFCGKVFEHNAKVTITRIGLVCSQSCAEDLRAEDEWAREYGARQDVLAKA